MNKTIITLTLILLVLLSGCGLSEGRKFHAICYDINYPEEKVEFDFGEWNIYHANSYAEEKCKNIFNKITGVYIEVKQH